MEENYKQLLRQRLKPVVLGGPDYEVCYSLAIPVCTICLTVHCFQTIECWENDIKYRSNSPQRFTFLVVVLVGALVRLIGVVVMRTLDQLKVALY